MYLNLQEGICFETCFEHLEPNGQTNQDTDTYMFSVEAYKINGGSRATTTAGQVKLYPTFFLQKLCILLNSSVSSILLWSQNGMDWVYLSNQIRE